MLPTKGYFQDIECPYYNSSCGRPYCHFRHRKKLTDNVEELVNEPEKEDTTVIPTYKPTPKSELANIHSKSHIPISYVPDLTFRPERKNRPPPKFEKPTYKPTPLSILSSASNKLKSIGDENGENIEAIEEIKQNIANMEYDPATSLQSSDIDFEGLDTEFAIIDEIIRSTDYKKKRRVLALDHETVNNLEVTEDCEPDQQLNQNTLLGSSEESTEIKEPQFKSKTEKTISEVDNNKKSDSSKEKLKDVSSESIKIKEQYNEKKLNNEKYKKSEDLKKDKEHTEPNKKRSEDNKKRSEDTKKRSDDSKKTEIKGKDSSDKNKSSEKSKKHKDDKKDKEKSKNDEKSHKNDEKSHKSDDKSHKSDDKSHKSEDKLNKSDDKSNKSDEKSHTSSREKHRKEELKDRKDKNDKSRDKQKRNNQSISRSRSRSRSNEKLKSKGDSEDKQKEKGTHRERREKSCSKQTDKDRSSESKRSKNENEEGHKSKSKKEDKEQSIERSREKRKSKERSEDRRKSKERSEDRRKAKEHSEDKNKSKNKHKESEKSKGKNKHDNSKTDESKNKNKDGSSKNKKNTIVFSSDESMDDSDKDVSMNEIDNIEPMEAEFEEDEDETLIECYKIFNEYIPTPKEQLKDPEMFSPDHSSRDSLDLNPIKYSSKKRIAHATVERTYSELHPPEKPKSVSTPGQTLSNRYKLAKMAQANREQELLMNEVQQPIPVKRSAPSLLEAARARKIRKENTITNHVNTNLVDDILKGSSNKMIPPAPPRPKIAPAQNVSLMAKAKERISKIAQAIPTKTVAQTQKGARVAHVPDTSLADIPDVLQADRSKLPVNVRTRFLTMLADECVKLYISKEEAFSRAINEEFACYEKCKVLATYRNSAMLAVNRLRKEIQERNANGLGLIAIGEDDSKGPDSDSKGNKFYNKIKHWILTEEELDIHGYPRESEDHHGKAVIKNSKFQPSTNLDENQRLCCRCQKIYQVDDDGWPLFDEECIYHPMKKRTIRGEQVYLCCRSNDETGCATSDTHVSESFGSADLEGFQTTLDPESESDPRSYAVYALDCEMCYTTKGLELTRVTIVDSDCKTVYESLVKPLNPIIDYNTRFSGITKEQMDRTSTSILQVQANILHLCNSKTILVGHSLESDMKALKIVHGTIIDTSVLFPHKMGLPHKRALRALASEYLRKIIQNNVSGHDSAEDAVTCMELLKWKLKEETKSRPSK